MPLNENAVNEIQPFADEGLEASGDLLSLSAYKAHPMRKRGHMPGIALRELQNRASRQAAHMAAGLAQFIANRYEPGVVDDAELDKIEEGLRFVIQAMMDAGSVPLDRKIETTAPLMGGGELSEDLMLEIDPSVLSVLQGAAPMPKSTSGVGQWAPAYVEATTITLPAGGTWAYYLMTAGQNLNPPTYFRGGVAAGGTVINPGSVGRIFGFWWRIA
ncbi:MAG: hypothetical protein LBH94_07355 [Deltaproteobacteria bacterium]|jgi:hypothetical protein|nr:hypothetical protein [Deltaproteobacteria bacterium]